MRIAPRARLAPEPRPRATPLRDLPPPPRMLVGREAELVACAEAAPGRPLEVHGPAGIGKTTLLARVAHTFEAPADGVVFVPARGHPAADLRSKLFAAFWASEEPFVPAPDDLGRWLGGKRALVVLDDVEVDPAELAALLDAAPGCTFLIASDAPRLRGRGRSIALEGLAPDAALVLLARVRDRPLGAGEEGEAARALVRDLDGHPGRIVEAARAAPLRQVFRPGAAKPDTAPAVRAGKAAAGTALRRLTGPGARQLDTAPVVAPAELPALELELARGGLLGSWGHLLREALPAARESGDETQEAYLLHELGAHALAVGARADAVRHFRAALRLRERLGDRAGAKLTNANLRAIGAKPRAGAEPRARLPRHPARAFPLTSPRAALLVTAAVALLATAIALTATGGTQREHRTTRAPAPQASLAAPAIPGHRPAIRIEVPRDGVIYGRTNEVTPRARYSCRPALGTRLRSCAGPARPGAPLDTHPGRHAFIVTATVEDGTTAHATTRYTVDPTPPSIEITAPPFGPGEPTVARFECRDALSGIDSCVATDPAGNAVRDGDELPITGSLTVTATDRAGNTIIKTVDYKPPPAPGVPVT